MPRRPKVDLTTLQMALAGYEIEKQKIESKIREIRGQLKGRKAALPAPVVAPKRVSAKRVLSQAARRRIAAAAKKRWAEFRKRSRGESIEPVRPWQDPPIKKGA